MEIVKVMNNSLVFVKNDDNNEIIVMEMCIRDRIRRGWKKSLWRKNGEGKIKKRARDK